MPSVFRRWISIGLAVLCIAALPAAADASMPEGPRLAIGAWGIRPPAVSLIDTDSLGGAGEALFVHGLRNLPFAEPGSALSWSPDGSTLAFTAAVGVRRNRFSSGPRTKIFVIPADGGKPRPVSGTTNGVDPVFSPDGHTIAYAVVRKRLRANGQGGGEVAYEAASIWLADVAGGGRTQVSPWRNGLTEWPSSFSPDGTDLAAARRVGKESTEAVVIGLASGGTTVLAEEALGPVYSPSGTEIAFLQGRPRSVTTDHGTTTATFTDLFVMHADGSDSRRLTHTAKEIETAPSWDPSGSRLAFTRFRDPSTEAGFFGFGNAVMEINADGSCPTKILQARQVSYFGASWRPGLGRAAGPLTC
jgi:Tol biopolymer transport system component